jgi:thioredoxin-like negative regulator of GroEL
LVTLTAVLPGSGYPLWSLGLLKSAVLECTAIFLAAVLGLGSLLLLVRLFGRTTRAGWVLAAFSGLWILAAWLLRDQLYLVADSMVNFQTVELSGDILIAERAPLATGLLELGARIFSPWASPSVLYAWVSVLSGWATGLLIWRWASREGESRLDPAVFLALVFAQPMSFVFYGHVETYPLYLVAFTAVLALLKRDLARGRIGPVFVIFVVALCFMHYVTVLLLLPVVAWLGAKRLGEERLVFLYLGLLVSGLAVLFAVPTLREYTLAARDWSSRELADYLWDVLNGWIILFVPLGFLIYRFRRAVFRDDLGRVLGLIVLTYSLFPLVTMFDLGVYRDLDLLSPAFVTLCFLVALGIAREGVDGSVFWAFGVGIVLLAAIQVHNICPAGAREMEKHLNRGAMEEEARWIGTEVLSYHYRREGNLGEAARLMERAIADRPENLRLYGPLGEIQLALGDTATAISSLTKAMNSWRALRTAPLLGELLARTGQPERAIEILSPLRGDLLADTRASAALAVAFFRAGLPESTLVVAEDRLAVDPSDHIAHFNAASAWASMGYFEEAAGEMERAIAVDPKNLGYHQRLVQVLLRMPDGLTRAQTYLDQLPPALRDSLIGDR